MGNHYNMKKRLLKVFLAAALFWGGLPVFAQNVIVNGDFEQGYTGFDTEYSVDTDQIGEGCYCIDNTSAGHAGGVAWYPVTGYGGSGMYMLVNGFGSSVQTPKFVWKQTVNVTSQTTYTFSCQLANLSQGVLIFDPEPAIIQLKINGINVGESLTMNVSNGNWQSMTRTWNSGNYFGPVDIEIYDLYQGNPGLGDDFGLDQISFVPGVVYSITANDDEDGSVCLDSSIEVDVLANDVASPNANDVIVSVTLMPQHGTVNVLPNNKIQYTFTDANYIGSTDQFKYQVNNHGAMDEAWVTVTLGRAPEVAEITPPEGICAGESFELTAPVIDDNGSAVTGQGWEIGPTYTGPFTMLSNNDIPFDYNGYYLRYYAVNDCDTGCSEPVQVTVYSTAPTFDTITACDAYMWNQLLCDHSDNYSAQVTTDDGCEITAHLHFTLNEDYFIESQTEVSCDEFFWPQTDITYDVTGVYFDTVDSGNPIICDSIYTLYLTINKAPELQEYLGPPFPICSGDILSVTPPQYVENHTDGATYYWEYATSSEGPFLQFDPNDNHLGFGYYFLRFVVVNECGSDISNVVPFRVNYKPEIQGTLSAMQVCEGFELDLPEIDVDWKNEDGDERIEEWQISEDGVDFQAFDTTTPMQLIHDGQWLRFMAANSCGESILGPVRITVMKELDIWDTIPACNYYILPSNQMITVSQMIDYEIAEPCPHTLHRYFAIHHSDTVVEPITSCKEVFVWHNQTYSHADGPQIDYWQTTNIHGCDSVVELRLDFGPHAAITEFRSACDEYVWPRNNQLYTASQIDSVFISSTDENVCDSMIYLNLTLGHFSEQEIDTSACEAFWWHGNVWCHDGQEQYTQSFETLGGCDSIVHMNVRWIHADYSTQFLERCDSITINGTLYDQPGGPFYIYLDTLQSQVGCDSLIRRISLTISNSGYTGTIQGDANVFVATNLISGIYRYEIDNTGIEGDVLWSLSNPDWLVYDSGENWCRVLVTTPGVAELKATFFVEGCGEMERRFTIHAGFYDTDEHQAVGVKVFPNPTEGSVTIEAEGIKSIRVIDMLGETLKHECFDGFDSVSVRLETLPPSVYLFEVQTEKGRAMRRVVLCK